MNSVWIMMVGMILAFIGFVFLGKSWGETEDEKMAMEADWFKTYRVGVWCICLGLGSIIVALLIDNYDYRKTKQISILR